MTAVYAFERCPFRDASHVVADRSAVVRRAARTVWPAARRAERVEVSADGIEAWTLAGRTRLAWAEVADVSIGRSPLGRRTLRIRGAAGRIEVASILPGYAELEQRVLATHAAA